MTFVVNKCQSIHIHANKYILGGRYFGIYYDDPDVFNDHSQLRSELGFLIATKSLLEKERATLLKEFEEKGYTYIKFNETECLHDTFPFRWPRFLAPYLGAKKYYPKLKELMTNDPSILKGLKEAPGFAAFETYTSEEIGFHFPLNNSAQFYLTKFEPPKLKSD